MLFTILVFAAVLGVLVIAHELGHFYSARIFKVKAEEFGFGLPPRFFGLKKINGKWKLFLGNADVDKLQSEDTVISFNWLPLGGFVKIKGEEGENKDQDSFAVQKPWKRTIILSAGVFMNMVLAMVLLSVSYMIGSTQVIDGSNIKYAQNIQPQIMRVFEKTPAEVAGVKSGDAILSLDGQGMPNYQEVQKYLMAKQDIPVTMEVDRFGVKKTLTVTPVYSEDFKVVSIGVGLADTGTVKYGPFAAVYQGAKFTGQLTGRIFSAFGSLIASMFGGDKVGMEVAGPVGIAVMTGHYARMGLSSIFQFVALLSINLAIINFLPLPALDGGRVLFIIIEKIRRRPVSQKIENIIHSIGFAILIALMLFITGRDLFHIGDWVNRF